MMYLDFSFYNYACIFSTAFIVGTLTFIITPEEPSRKCSSVGVRSGIRAKQIKDVEKLKKKFVRKPAEDSRKSDGSTDSIDSRRERRSRPSEIGAGRGPARHSRGQIGAGRGPESRSSRGGGRGPGGRGLGPRRNPPRQESRISGFKDDYLEDDDSSGAPSRQKSALQAERSSRFSTLNWLANYARSSGRHLNSNYDLKSSLHSRTSDTGLRPINIFCCDGGGAKGFTLATVFEVLESDLGTPLRDEFDLIAGTSIGGVAALMFNYFPGYGEANKHGVAFGKLITGGVFKNLNPLTLFSSGALFDKKDNRREVLKNMFGRYTCINNDRTPKAFCVATYEDQGKLRPYLMRTYDAPEEVEDLKVAEGTSQCRMWEAGVATSAAPVAFGRLEIFTGKDKDETLKLCDGCLVANDPTELALYEAMALYPGHPIGLVISVGTGRPGQEDDGSAPEGIEQKVRDAGGEYIRVNPIIGNVSPAESDPDRLTQLQMNVLDFMEEAPEAEWARKRLKEYAAARQERLKKEKEEAQKQTEERRSSDYLEDDSTPRNKFSIRSSIFGRVSDVRNSIRASVYGAASEVKRRTSYALGRNSALAPIGSPTRPVGRIRARASVARPSKQTPKRNSSMQAALSMFTALYGDIEDDDIIQVTENNEDDDLGDMINNPTREASESQFHENLESHREEEDEDYSSDENAGPTLSIEQIIKESQAKASEEKGEVNQVGEKHNEKEPENSLASPPELVEVAADDSSSRSVDVTEKIEKDSQSEREASRDPVEAKGGPIEVVATEPADNSSPPVKVD